MSDDDFETPWWRRWLLNRFVMVPVAILAIAGVWNLWVMTHDDGLVSGRVVDAAGRPVEGASVTLWAFNFTTFSEVSRVATDANGAFRFDNNKWHNIQVGAEKPGVGRAARLPVRLYFRSQNIALSQPLVLTGS